MTTPFVSICILSYNRPETLDRLLKTIDLNVPPEQMEVVVCEDHSPRQAEIRKVVEDFAATKPYKVSFHGAEKNLGYDGNFNQLVKSAKGEWLVFMGDDDEFVVGAFDKVYAFLQQHRELAYVMKSHYLIHENGQKEAFKYFKETTFFPAGEETYVSLFRRSVFIAGFMIKRESAVKHMTDRFDGTMLMQLYYLAEAVLKHPSAYLDIPFTQQYLSHEHNKKDVMFDREKKQFMARKPTLDISLKFLNSFSMITEDIDRTHGLNTTAKIKKDMSKYFYPSLAVHRNSGPVFFLRYVKELNKLGFNSSIYYYIYVFLLLILGKKTCDWGIFQIKQFLGRTPQL